MIGLVLLRPKRAGRIVTGPGFQLPLYSNWGSRSFFIEKLEGMRFF
jgi:hypothetical protein